MPVRAVSATGATLRRLSLVLLAAVLVISACGDDTEEDSTDAAGAPSADDLDGRTFVSTSVTGQTLTDGTQVTIDFADGNVAVVAGCNTHTGGFAVEDGALVAEQLASTRMMCDEGAMAEDEWLVALLGASPTVALADGTLTLTSPDVTLTLVELEAGADTPLVGAWAIESLGEEEPPEGAALTFAAATVAVATGCNNGSGGYTVDGETLTIGPLAVTAMACEEPLATWETTLLTFLGSPLTFTVDGDELTLSDGSTELVAANVP